MNTPPRLWLRHETRATERRAPIVPGDARRLIDAGFAITVEESPQRVFPAAEYAAAGCAIAPALSWVDAPADTIVLGLKELPEAPEALVHRHIFFGHAYKEQPGAERLLRRFAAGGGELLDLEYLVDDAGRRLAAFGYWAGYIGAALAVLHLRGALETPLHPMTRAELDDALRDPLRPLTVAERDTALRPPLRPPTKAELNHALLSPLASLTSDEAETPPRRSADGDTTRALVVGALGRSGHGARDALTVAGIPATRWDRPETAKLDREALLDHDILVNTVLATGPMEPFLRPADVESRAGRLAVVCDVTCDAGSPFNALPIYEHTTTWDVPAQPLRDGEPPLDLIAIDNLPSLLPLEATIDFSADLTPQLATLGTPGTAWDRCAETFRDACRRVGIDLGGVHV
jgi:saccharopine dehydrogenase (NAD+, L-lysine-forming)